MTERTEPDVIWLEEEDCRDRRRAGGKGASLAAMAAVGLPVPRAFVIPAHVLPRAVDAERLRAHARARDHTSAQALVRAAEPPREAVTQAYARIGGSVAVRSSACAEDSEHASYAGQQDTFLHVEGSDEVCRRVVDCWASFFGQRALFYREQKGSLDDLGMAVVVQRLIEADKAGVVFTADPVQRRRDRIVVEAVFGLGEQVVSGEVTPDHYVVDRAGAIVREHLVNGGVLTTDELRQLVEMGRRLEEQFGCPQDIEWAIAQGQLFLLQSRPVTTL
jgi:pyruvate,water dikinase